MATVLATGLTATVRYTEVRTEGPNGRRKLLTEVQIKAGAFDVASKTLAGRWSQQQAIREFKRLPLGWSVKDAAMAALPAA